MPLSAGDKIGPYEILEPIGSGGMGEVWKARDTRLNRLVAIKTSHSNFSERFEREARASAALNHPHICSLYDVGPDYLVMEYVEGEVLRGPVPLPQALALANQMLEALDAAHRAGIVHRDLKPANILLGRNGVKILDFGLAKFQHATVAASGGGTQAATETTPLTAEGSILGTLPYMSPEQIEGRAADARSDIFAFGVVLYELITGRRPFSGNSPASLIASILKERPQPLNELAPLAPAGIAQVVQTCLEKDVENRWQSAREVKHALTWISAEALPGLTATRSVRLWQGLAALAILIAAGAAGWLFWSEKPGQTSRFEVTLPENISPSENLSVSPDGRKLAFSSAEGNGLWIRSLDALEWRHLSGTEGSSTLFWSPDSRYLGFVAGEQIKKLDTLGGPPETICALPGNVISSAAWNQDGVIIVGSWGGGSGGPLWKVSQAGGAATAVTQTNKEELYHTWPTFLPDGRHFLYFRSGTPEGEGIYAGSLEAKPAEQPQNRILASAYPASYANGYLFFTRANTLMAQPFDTRRLRLEGAPVSVAENILTTWFGTGAFSVSPSGTLVYRTGSATGNVQLTWVDRQGKALSTIGSPGTDFGITLSPDGKRAVVKDSPYDVPGDLWTLDFATGRRTRLTFHKDVYSPGVWSPDGARIAYAAGNFGDKLCDKASSGAGDERELLKEPGLRHYATDWSRDGRFLLYHTENAPRTGYDEWVLPLQGNRKPVLLLGDTFNEWAGVFSPDMRWIAYASTEETRTGAEVYVRPFRISESGVPESGEGKWQISKGGGNWPRWPSDKEIIFDGGLPGTDIWAVPVKTSGDAFQSEGPQRLVATRYVSYTGADVTRDGQRLLLAVPLVQRTPPNSIAVVLNWTALVKK